MLRVQPRHDALQPDVQGQRIGVLLRGKHAGGGAAHVDVRAHQRDAAVCAADRFEGMAGRGTRRRRVGARGQCRRWHGGLRARRASPRPAMAGTRRGAGLTDIRRQDSTSTSASDAAPSRDLTRALEACLDHPTVERGLARHTLSSYRRDLTRYVHELSARGVGRLSEATESDVAEFLAALRRGDAEHPPLRASSAARAVVAVRGLHRFAVREGLAPTDAASGVRPPTLPQRLPKALPVDDVLRLLEFAGDQDTPRGLRDRALLELLYGTGARISEAVGLAVDDVDLEGAAVLLHGKGSKDRLVPLGQYARGSVEAYLVRG